MKPKHPPKVNIWAEISRRGRYSSCNIHWNTYGHSICRHLEEWSPAILGSCISRWPPVYDNPKHTSRYAQWWYEENEINWWKTPASSPDLNSIGLLWHTLQEFLRNEYKPHNLSELKQGIKTFWESLTPETCSRYIGHLKKVISKVLEVNGGPSGY